MKKFFKRPIMVSGLEKSGKTSFLLAFNRLAERRNVQPAFLKPFDTGLIEKNAAEEKTDGELFAEAMKGDPGINMVSPYLANEKYPVEAAFQRDGIRIDWKYVHKCLSVMGKHYDLTLIETPASLMTPLTEEKMVHEWMKEDAERIIWLVDPNIRDFERNLAEIDMLKRLEVEFHILINNVSKVGDTDFVFYFWQKVEKLSGKEVEGMLPRIHARGDDLYSKLASKMEANAPRTIETLFQTP